MGEGQVVKVRITRHRVDLDPDISVFRVELEGPDGGVWPETLGSEDHLRVFLRGVEATLGVQKIYGGLPEVPTEITSVLREKPTPSTFASPGEDDVPF